VTEEDFQKLVEELRPTATETQHSTKFTTDRSAARQSSPVAQAGAEQVSTTNGNDDHEAMDEEDGDIAAQPNDVFKEFVHVWKNVRPGGAFSKDVATDRPQQRRLDVLSWGFGG
jgi:hypothetical protein